MSDSDEAALRRAFDAHCACTDYLVRYIPTPDPDQLIATALRCVELAAAHPGNTAASRLAELAVERADQQLHGTAAILQG